MPVPQQREEQQENKNKKGNNPGEHKTEHLRPRQHYHHPARAILVTSRVPPPCLTRRQGTGG